MVLPRTSGILVLTTTPEVLVFDPLTLLAGAGILGVGFLAGRRGRRKSPAPPQAFCGCGHGLEQHDPEARVCKAEVTRGKYDSLGEWVGYTYAPCTCQQYVGPKPLEEMFAQRYLPPAD